MSTPRHRRTAPRSRSGPLAIGAIFLIAGLLFAASAQLGARQAGRSPSSLRDLVAAEKTRQDERAGTVTRLVHERDALLGTDTSQPTPQPGATFTAGDEVASATSAVSGPGLTVTLNDAPAGGVKPPGTRPDDLVVHQGDIEAVMNALWHGGAEAMAVQGQRIAMTTAVKCVGNVLLLHGQVYSPPYRIEAIGPTDSMRRALDESPQIAIYRQWATAVGLGWGLEESDRLELPPFDDASTGLRYATPLAGE